MGKCSLYLHFSDVNTFFPDVLLLALFSFVQVLCPVFFCRVWGFSPFPFNYKQPVVGLPPFPIRPLGSLGVKSHFPRCNLGALSRTPPRCHEPRRARKGAVFATARSCARATRRPHGPSQRWLWGRPEVDAQRPGWGVCTTFPERLRDAMPAVAGLNRRGLHFPARRARRCQRRLR